VELSSQVAQQISMAYVIAQMCNIHTGMGVSSSYSLLVTHCRVQADSLLFRAAALLTKPIQGRFSDADERVAVKHDVACMLYRVLDLKGTRTLSSRCA
jgi:hypothetical protein